MYSESANVNHELLTGKVAIQPPAVESLLDTAQADEVWPSEIATDETFINQCNERRKLVENMEEVLNRIPLPTTTLEKAIALGQISENQAEELYNSLIALLENPDYRRALLYLPFEFLPQASWRPDGEHLQQVIDRFRTVYLTTWRELLTIHDVRASFVDGDVLEVEQRTDDLERVVKAAHLIPKIVQNGLMETSEVIQLMEESDDPILKASIADAIPVLENLTDGAAFEPINQVQAESVPITLANLQQELDRARTELSTLERGDATEKRWQWLSETKMEKVIDGLSNRVSSAIISGDFSATDISSFLNADSTAEYQGVLVEGIRKAVESTNTSSPEEALVLFQSFAETLSMVEATASSQTKQLLAKTFRRLHSLGVVGPDVLEQFGISVPNLTGPMSENIKLIAPELQEMARKILTEVKSSGLDASIYPTVLLCGSKIKGYGEKNSDIDGAIFVKPGTLFSENTRIRELFPDLIEFWLENDGDQLRVHNFPAELGSFLGESYWIHNLFGGAWAGDKAVVDKLRKNLLTPYLYETEDELHDQNFRNLCLEEMEKGMLQYRLMHKYERFAPNYGGIDTPNADRIDGQSAFWDSGYRRVATLLYAKRVFLPKLTK